MNYPYTLNGNRTPQRQPNGKPIGHPVIRRLQRAPSPRRKGAERVALGVAIVLGLFALMALTLCLA